MAENYYDLTTGSVRVYDPAGRQMLGYTNALSASFLYFMDRDKVIEAADRALKSAAYPSAVISFKANRKAFKLQPGDIFKFTYSPWQITNMVCRVLSIQETELGSEELNITVIEDIEYISDTFSYFNITPPDSQVDPFPPYTTGRISNFKVMEAPYELADEYVKMIPMAGKVTGQEDSYYVYESTDDGTTYINIGSGNFNHHGRLAEEYPESAITIDDAKGVLVTFSVSETLGFSDTIRTAIFGTKNLAVIGNEFITFQTVTLVSGSTYRLLGVNRSLYGSQKKAHPIGTDFFFIGDGFRTLLTFQGNPTGSNRRYKFVPISGGFVGNIENATTPYSHTYAGRALCPYAPSNLKVNGRIGAYATYTGDNVLTWSPAVRGEGAGEGIASSVVDAAVSWEGYFRVKVYAHSSPLSKPGDLVRTTEDIDDDTWTYTSAMNTSDNGSLSDYVTFEITNYLTALGIEYESFVTRITVRKE